MFWITFRKFCLNEYKTGFPLTSKPAVINLNILYERNFATLINHRWIAFQQHEVNRIHHFQILQ